MNGSISKTPTLDECGNGKRAQERLSGALAFSDTFLRWFVGMTVDARADSVAACWAFYKDPDTGRIWKHCESTGESIWTD